MTDIRVSEERAAFEVWATKMGFVSGTNREAARLGWQARAERETQGGEPSCERLKEYLRQCLPCVKFYVANDGHYLGGVHLPPMIEELRRMGIEAEK